MSEKKYNGYANYETWCVHLWLSNEQATYNHWRQAAKSATQGATTHKYVTDGTWTAEIAARATLAEQLKESLESLAPLKGADLYSDLLYAAIGEVDWQEVAEAFLEGLQPEPVEPKRSWHLVSANPRFELGRTVSTPAALMAVSNEQILTALNRHIRGDWGIVCDDDWQENELSLKEGFRLLSVYETAENVRFWIITEADRSVTTVLLPSDY